MNGMKQGLIIGVVAGLFFGFMLGRFGVEDTKHTGLMPTKERTAPKGQMARTGRGGGLERGVAAPRGVERYNVKVGNAPSFGPKDALVTIVEFSDFECPFCTRGANTINMVKKVYGDKVRVAFRHRPLSFHRNAHLAAQASMAAHEQGKFWPYHDKLFQNFRNINKANLVTWAKELGLDAARFQQALDSGKYKAYVDADDRYAQQIGAGGTPTFFVNGRILVGAQPFARFKQLIDQEIATAQKLIASGTPKSRVYQAIVGKGLTRKAQPRPQAAPSGPRKQIALGNAPSWGPANAKVTIVEFSDFECPFCTRGASVMRDVKKAYGNKVRVVFKHLPLPFHRNAHLAAQASMAAHAQGKFWPYHDKLFQNFRNLNKANFVQWAKELGLDAVRFQQDLDSGKYKAYVDADLAQARREGANGTPTFFVNGRSVVGAQPFDQFKTIIDAELSGRRPTAQPSRPSVAIPSGRRIVAKNTIPVGNSPSFGPANAPVTIVEFSDFECPFCTRGANTMEQVKKAYGNKVRVVFKHLPLPFHRNAHLAAQASMAAHAQGKFWPYHDKLFQNFRNLNKANFVKWAQELGLDMARFQRELDGGTYKAVVDADLALARQNGANGTPTFIINGQKVVGAQPFEKFQQVINDILSGKAAPSEPTPAPAAAGARKKLLVGSAPTWGPANAKITIVEFSDFECPFCTRGASVMREVKKAYGNQVRVVFKHLPLSFHRNAKPAAVASMAAHRQGKFWQFHDKLFANFRNLNKNNYIKWAQEVGLDVERFKKDLDDPALARYVDADAAYASSVGANGTPTFFINGFELGGAQPFFRFKQIIDAELAGKPIPGDAPQRPRPSAPPSKVNINIGNAPSWGPANAKVTIVEFSDFECPFCSRGATTVEQLKKDYAGKIRVVFKHLPLSFHRNAKPAAVASMAAHRQGKFWEFHDKLFANFRNLNQANYVKWAQEVGLDVERFKKDLNDPALAKYVDADASYANSVGANGTPTFFVNGHILVGAQPIFRFKQMIDAALAGKAMPGEAAPQRPRQPEAAPIVKINLGDAPALGPADAKVTIVEFSDFECPFCSRGAKTMDEIKKNYGDKVRLVFKHLPLSFHRNAKPAAVASMAAHRQGKFWEFHDKLFANFRNLNQANYIKWAQEVGLDVERFKKDLDDPALAKYVDADASYASSIGANGTPTFFVNGLRVVGAQPYSRFKQVIEDVLAGKALGRPAAPQPARPQAPSAVKVAIGNAPSFGPADAKVTIVEFSDFECPFCTRGANTMEQVKKAYGDKVRVVFKHLPLPFHRNAHLAAQASMAAHAQGKFWPYHDKLFQNFRNLNKENFVKWAQELGLDMARFQQDLDSGKYKAYVDADLAQASEVGANGTPTFFINGRSVVGAQPFAQFKTIIDEELAKAGNAKPAPRLLRIDPRVLKGLRLPK